MAMSGNFKQAPKPAPITPDQIAAFERAGQGDTRTKGTAQAVPAEPTQRLSIDLPLSKHTRFKTACSATKRKMAVEIRPSSTGASLNLRPRQVFSVHNRLSYKNTNPHFIICGCISAGIRRLDSCRATSGLDPTARPAQS